MIHRLISDWAKMLSPWQSDAVRRLISQPKLAVEDENLILELLKKQHGFASDLEPQPLKGTPTGMQAKQVRIRALSSLQNVNALTTDQRLEFLPEGLTVVYGDNGSGKSGYSRVLKGACRSRDAHSPILSNILHAQQGEPTAVFELTVDEAARPYTWPHPRDPANRIPGVAVFDSRCSSIYVDKDNEVDFLPGGLDVFERLVKLQKLLQTRVEYELTDLADRPAIFTTIPVETVSGRFLQSLEASTEESTVEKGLEFSVDSATSLVEQRRRLAELTAPDLVSKVEALRLRVNRVERHRKRLLDGLNSVSRGRATELTRLQAELANLEFATKSAADISFAEGFLPGTGNGVWKLLFEAAERFAVEYAYPNRQSTDIDHCVLCQQPLDQAAVDRMSQFRAFVRQDLVRRMAQVRTQLEAALSVLPADAPEPDQELLLADLGEMAEDFLSNWKTVVARANCLRRSETLPGVPASLDQPFSQLIGNLNQKLTELNATSNPGLVNNLRQQVLDLETSEKLSVHAADVRVYYMNLKTRTKLTRCIDALNSLPITQAAKRITSKVLTDRLSRAFAHEVAGLAEERISVDLQGAGKAGQAVHRVRLTKAKGRSTQLSNVLSEGEQKVIGLASFFAELETSAATCAVFDDPVTSLDHEFQERVATRIAKAAQKYQVIVFTHDVFFCNLLAEEASHYGVAHQLQTIYREGNKIGLVGGEEHLSWKDQKVRQRLDRLRDKLAQSKHLVGDEREMLVRYLASQLRSTWERAIEELLFKDVVIRYRRAVQTLRLKDIDIRHEDVETINRAMTRLSQKTEAHDSPRGFSARLPSFGELEEWIQELQQFDQVLRKRSAEVKPLIHTATG